MKKIALGVSSCLLGNHVRYDGRHKLNKYITTILGQYFDLFPVCPETELGLTIPREPLILEGAIDNPRLITQTTRRDHTQPMLTWSNNRCDQLAELKLQGFIFKTKSPSCGLSRVEVFTSTGHTVLKGRGLFADIFVKRFSMLPVIDDVSIEIDESRDAFIEHVFVFNRWVSENPFLYPRGLARFHAKHMCLLMNHSMALYQKCSQLIALIDSDPFDHIIEEYQKTLLQALSCKITVKKTIDVLWYILSMLDGLLSEQQKNELIAMFSQYGQKRLPLETPLSLLRKYTAQFKIEHLLDQVFLHPDPVEIQLRNFYKPII